MKIQRLLVAILLASAISVSATLAGPCSSDVDRAAVEIDAMLKARAAAGPTAQESSAAMMHRQPTPRSIAAAESGLGDLSAEQVEAVKAAMARAREADGTGDQSTCERALADARQVFGR
jgi:hypothetical protein